MKEIRLLRRDSLRQMCIENGFYTYGCNESYVKLFNSINESKNITTKEIARIATDILEHSSPEHELPNICLCIAKTCNTFFKI